MTESLATDPNHAVDRCWAAYRQAVTEDMAAGSSKASAEYNSRAVYRRAMPRLHTRDDIRAFLACVADGLLFGMFDHNHGPQLLAAARAAAAALPRESRPVGRPKSEHGSITEELTSPVLEK